MQLRSKHLRAIAVFIAHFTNISTYSIIVSQPQNLLQNQAQNSSSSLSSNDPQATLYSTCYRSNKNCVNLWNNFHTGIGKGLGDFSLKYLQTLDSYKGSYSLFYPFGGADVLYPLLLFPQLRTITLIGLEPVGELNLATERAVDTHDKEHYIGDLLRKSFFITHQMHQVMKINDKRDIQGSQDSRPPIGIIHLILAQLYLLGAYDITILPLNAIYKGMCGVIIECNIHNILRRVIYIQTNLEDKYLDSATLDFCLTNKLLDITMLKATSYFMHYNNFSKLRNLIIKNTQVLLQDDTGIPVKYILDSFKDIKLFGWYSKPSMEEFKHQKQAMLQKMYLDLPIPTTLPFCFGYGCRKVPANMVLACK